MKFPKVKLFEQLLTDAAPYMAGSVEKSRSFSPTCEAEFDETLAAIFGDDQEKLAKATKGYVRFAIDGLRLHKRFEKELCYINKSYEDVAKAVYHNEQYMDDLYLPGILLSHYLWPHHYAQLLFFHEKFVPLMQAADDPSFADVGVGTGFYSRQMLAADPRVTGTGYDISEHSLAYAEMQVKAFGFDDRWQPCKRNIVTDPPELKTMFVTSVEVLEHLEDTISFIKGLKAMLAPGGYAFITAAITAPNEDHIYLYMNADEVRKELEQGGLTVVEQAEFAAYEPKGNEPVPINGAFICQ